MTVTYLETDVTDEGPIRWYDIDGTTCGLDIGWKILDSDGRPMVEGAETSELRKQIINYEAPK
jgi:hypothetical protein